MQEVIVKYNGDIASLGFTAEILSENYAILSLPGEDIPSLGGFTEIEYAEMPKRLSLSILEPADRSCIPAARNGGGYGLSGEGVLVAVIDSGVDYRHEDFISPNGESRIACIWDQTLGGTPPAGFQYGAEFSNAQINAALASDDPLALVPHQDYAGHGTAVAGIAAGNGRASEGKEEGVAPKAAIIAVKLGERDSARFARTTEIMRAIKYVYGKAAAMNMPVAVNLSYGTNDGAHDGDSLFEGYINDMAAKWKSVIVAASGNEGAAKHHFSGRVKKGETVNVSFSVDTKLASLALHLWKNFADTVSCEIIAPGGGTTGALTHTEKPALVHVDGVSVSIDYRQPSHYNQNNAFSLYFEAKRDRVEITRGVWTLKVTGEDITDGRFDVWLPTLEEVTGKTAFLSPSADTTLTVPSCAGRVITVGGYNSAIGAMAAFSGRGYTRENVYVKPDLAAPAVNIRTCRPGGGYGLFTGTSMAAPFVTGSAALMMQWGIAQGHDPYLYGQRVKAFLKKGAARDAPAAYPNNQWGYGALCLKASMDLLEEYSRVDSKGILKPCVRREASRQGPRSVLTERRHGLKKPLL